MTKIQIDIQPPRSPIEKRRVSSFWQHIPSILVVIAMYVGFLFNLDLGWTCLCAAVALIVFERKDPGYLFGEVNWELLLYISGLFVTIQGINHTPLPEIFWDIVSPMMSPHASLGLWVFGFSILVMSLCLVFTSIPAVLLVAPRIAQLNGSFRGFAWLLLSWCVTLSGNLTIFSSVAGVIASEANEIQPIGFWEWFKFAFPSTILILAGGATLLAFRIPMHHMHAFHSSTNSTHF